MMLKLWGVLSTIIITGTVLALVVFLGINAPDGLSKGVFFGDTPPMDALFKGAFVWDGLWNPLYGSIRLILLSGLFAIPMGLSTGIYLSEFSAHKVRIRLVTILESTAGLPSIIVGLFGFMLILIIHSYFFSARTCLLLASFCLAMLVLPALALNTYTALRGVPDSIRLTAASLGMTKAETVIKVLIPTAHEGIFSGLLMAAGRCAEDTAVILMTGAVASTGTATGVFDKFEALPFFIYYTGANYTDGFQLAQVFAAALTLLALTLVLMLSAMVLKHLGRASRTIAERGFLWMR